MPWKVTEPVSERVMFVAEYMGREDSVSELSRRYGISRKTAYKWINRVQAEGEAGLCEHSRAPHHCAHRLDAQREQKIVALRQKHATWGPRKLRQRLMRDYPEQSWPAASTIGELLRREGLSVPRRRRRGATPSRLPLTLAEACNEVWTADFKGHFAMGNGRRCTPLTIADRSSRFVIRCIGLDGSTGWSIVAPLFDAAFRQWGLPAVIRTDNGPPFASAGLGGLTKLSVWWSKLGIVHERIEAGQPQQNGAHERMHRVLKAETTRPPAANLREQQRRFERFVQIYNYERPHEGIAMATPGERFAPSPRHYPCPLAPVDDYPHGWIVRKVKDSGRIKWDGHELHLTDALTGEYVGLEPDEEDGWWNIYFGVRLLAHLDERTMNIVSAEKQR